MNPPDIKPSLYENLGFLIGKTEQIKVHLMEHHLAEYDITFTQIKLLGHLYFVGVTRPSEIGKYLRIDNSAVTRTIDRLEKKHFIRRIPDPNDRRSILIELTETGSTTVKQALPLADNAINQLTECLSAEETAQLKGYLKKILDHFLPQECRHRYVKESE